MDQDHADVYFSNVVRTGGCYVCLQRGYIVFYGECIERCDTDRECSREIIQLEFGRDECVNNERPSIVRT